MSVPHILLVGNAPFTNRGCEAIVRGTIKILEHTFGSDFRITAASKGNPDDIKRQSLIEYDPRITHIALNERTSSRQVYSLSWWSNKVISKVKRSINPDNRNKYRPTMLDEVLSDVIIALEIGGDNYSLDYGIPYLYVDIDNYLLEHAIPVVLWGASVGPFETKPRFARYMLSHLRKLPSIIVRESASYDYLLQHGIQSLVKMSDPAFVMDAIMPTSDKLGFALPSEAIGINLSPLLAKYIPHMSANAWIARCIDIVQAIYDHIGLPLILIPHVMDPNMNNDYLLLRQVADQLKGDAARNTYLVPDTLNAAETKGVISSCTALVAARTHATIAAFSTAVPTLSLAYSVKAHGLNRDLFGSLRYCLDPNELTPDTVADRLQQVLIDREDIRKNLSDKMPGIMQHAYDAGKALQALCKPYH